MVYVTRFPGESEHNLDWYEVFGTKEDAEPSAKEKADQLSEDTGKHWKVQYISAKSNDQYESYHGKNAVVIEQRYSLYKRA